MRRLWTVAYSLLFFDAFMFHQCCWAVLPSYVVSPVCPMMATLPRNFAVYKVYNMYLIRDMCILYVSAWRHKAKQMYSSFYSFFFTAPATQILWFYKIPSFLLNTPSGFDFWFDSSIKKVFLHKLLMNGSSGIVCVQFYFTILWRQIYIF